MSQLIRMIFGALVCALVNLAMTPARAQSNPCFDGGPGACADEFVAVNIWIGVVQLYSAGGQLLSTNSYMTVESTVGENGFSSFVAPLQAQSDATYIEDNTALPAIVRDNIASFVGSNGLGTAWDGVTTPTPAEQALYSLLTAQVPPFVITSDTGDVPFGAPFEFVSAWGPLGPVPGSANVYVIGTTNTDVYERTIDERLLTAVPEPSTWAMMLIAFAGLGFAGYCSGRRAVAAT